jgi:hypothetical protein
MFSHKSHKFCRKYKFENGANLDLYIYKRWDQLPRLIDWLFPDFFPLKNSSHTWRCHHYHLMADKNLSLCSVLGAFEQGGIFIAPHLLWHGASVFPVSSEGPPHSVASYYIQEDAEDLYWPGSSRVQHLGLCSALSLKHGRIFGFSTLIRRTTHI